MFAIGKGFKWVLSPYFDDEGGGGSRTDVQELPEVPSPSDDDIEALAGDDDSEEESDQDEDDEKKTDQDEDEDKDEDEDEDAEEVDKEKEDEDKIEEEEEEEEDKDKKAAKDEDKEPDAKRVPSIKALKTAYPDIFKKFPHVRTAIAEHQQFRSLYSSIDEAREAADAQESFNTITDKIVDDGDFGFLFDEVAKADPTAATRMAKNILPALLERNRDLYMDITDIPITQFVHAAYRRAKADGNKNLEHSAVHLWRFLGKEGMPSPREVGPDPKDVEFQNKVKEFEGRKFTDARSSVNDRISEELEGLIEHQIDPKGVIKPTVKRALVNELIRLVDTDVSGDRNHMARVERLWANARRSSYANGHLSRIISAYLERAKHVLPKHARKVREENDIEEPKDKKKDERRPEGNRGQNAPPPRPSAHGNPPRPKTIRDTNPRDIDWNRTSDVDVLGGKAVLRRR